MSIEDADWGEYDGQLNGQSCRINVDLAYRNGVPLFGKPWLLWVWVGLRDPAPAGRPSERESAVLKALEMTLTTVVDEQCAGHLVGRVTGERRREFYFYAPSDVMPERITEAMREPFPLYAIEADVQHDSEWQQYRRLSPTPADLRRIVSQRLFAQLRQQGDIASLPRPVTYRFAFKSTTHEAAFVQHARQLGFEPNATAAIAAPGSPGELAIVGREPVMLDQIDSIVEQLEAAARLNRGDFLGWHCDVQRGSSGS